MCKETKAIIPAETLEYFNNNTQRAIVFLDRYAAYGELTWSSTVNRLVRAILDIDNDPSNCMNLFTLEEAKDLTAHLLAFRFIPGGRIINSMGNPKNAKATLYNCITLPRPHDSIEGIMESAREIATVLSRGAGVGIRLDSLRPTGATVHGANGLSSGSCSFGTIFDTVASTINQGGSRRGAMLMAHGLFHPDVKQFITMKQTPGVWTNSNITVFASDEELKRHPKRLQVIAQAACASAEPGMLFTTTAEATFNVGYQDRQFEGVNACSEILLPSYGCCLLGSINLANISNLDQLHSVAVLGMKFLYLCHIYAAEHALYPIPTEKNVTFQDKRIGLGIMGLAHYFIQQEITYGEQPSLDCIDHVYSAIHKARETVKQQLKSQGHSAPIAWLSCQPTGTTSILAGTSSGIEPVFQKAYTRSDRTGTHIVKDPYYDSQFMRTAYEIPPDQRVQLQAQIQQHLDNAISSTINLPASATPEHVANIFDQAHSSGCVSVTVYRDGSREGVLTTIKPTINIPKTLSIPKRPDRLAGISDKFSFNGSNLYVTVNVDNETQTPAEVAVFSYGGFEQWSKATTVLCSLLLRAGYNPTKLAEKLESIEGPFAARWRGHVVKSQPAAIAAAIRATIAHYNPDKSDNPTKPKGITCPACGMPNATLTGRCVTCLDCGYTSCD